MAVLRIKVPCFRCRQKFHKAHVRLVLDKNEKKYECFNCYRKIRPVIEEGEKKPFYCEKCRYSFKSKKPICPYCNNDRGVVGGDVSVRDLL